MTLKLPLLINYAKRALAASRWLFVPAALVFFVAAAWRARAIVASILGQTDFAPLLITVLIWSSLHLVSPVFSWIVLRELGVDIRYTTLLGIHVGRLPTRYLPGGIWHTVSRVIDLSRIGVDRTKLSVMVLLENFLPVAVATMLGGTFLCLSGLARWPALLAVIAGPVFFIVPLMIMRHRHFGAGRGFAFTSYLKLAAVTASFWIFAATAFFSYWSAFPGQSESVTALQLYGIYLLSWVTGFVSVFAPQGIGVFESVAGMFLQGTLTFAGAAVLVAGFRVAVMAADLLAYAVLLVVRFTRKSHAPQH